MSNNISSTVQEALNLINEFAPIANRATVLAEKLGWPDMTDAIPMIDRDDNAECQLSEITVAMRKALCILLGAAAEETAYPIIEE